MRLGIRLLFAFFLINGIAAFFVLRVFMAEIKPSVREVMEDMMVDTANILAELASEDLAAGRLAAGADNSSTSPFAQHVLRYATRPIDAAIWGFSKQSLDYRIYVTDTTGRVLFDSENRAVGADYSRWRDVARTLRGEYGARSTRDVEDDDTSGVMHVAAPIYVNSQIAGVLTVAKPTRTVQRFIDRAERKVFMGGLLLLALSAAVGVAVTLWMVWNVRRLRDYALSVQGPADSEHGTLPAQPLAVPQVPGELGDLARAMDRMRVRLEGRDYIEGYVRALTHELKSPVAAIRGAGELLQDELPAADRAEFATQVVQQSERLQRLIDRLLELSKLEQRQHAEGSAPVALHDCAAAAIARGRKVAAGVQALVVPGSEQVKAQAEAEGLDKIFLEAGFEWRLPGCSMCLAMNNDRLQPGERCASTSNRNFEGRQGRAGRTHLVSPAMAAAAAVTGRFADIRAL